MSVETRLKDGRWVPAQPIPLYKDSRGYLLRFYHVWYFLFGLLFTVLFRRSVDDFLKRLDKKTDAYMVPMEPPYDDT